MDSGLSMSSGTMATMSRLVMRAKLNLLDAHIFDNETGHFVSEKHRIVAGIVNDYDANLRLVWIPPEKRSFDEGQPFAILHFPDNATAYILRKLSEGDVNEHLIAWLWSNDNARNGRDLHGYLAALDNAKKAMQLKKEQEDREQNNDFLLSILKGKNYYRHNGRTIS